MYDIYFKKYDNIIRHKKLATYAVKYGNIIT